MLRILAAVAALCIGLSVNAADQTPVSRVAAAEQAPEWNRTGFYVGAVAGYTIRTLETEGINFSNRKLMGGGLIGFNARVAPQLVLGVEGDWVFTSVGASSTVDGVTVTASSRHLISVRGRAGVPVGPALLYLTLGPAWQHAKLGATDGEASISDSVWQLGVVGGAGMELELTRSLAARLEVLHYMFPKDGAPLADFVRTEDQQTVGRAGLVFKLN